LVLAALSGDRWSLTVAALLVASVVFYDLAVKRTWLGPEVMGSCRALNVLLGMSQAPAFGGAWAWLVPAALGFFVVGVTWISRSETESGRSAGAISGWVIQNVAILGLVAAALGASHFPTVDSSPGRPIIPLEGLLVLLLVAWAVNLATGTAVRDPIPARLQKAVKTGVLSLVWLNVGVVAAVRGPIPALAVAALWLPAFLLGRWIYST
jgi:4-hydroxybenzoate polyprenyltransferase